ncbi:unnamed protein product [Lasius platythorax]|uniref:Uncharacterized protein n=1 Tax=Lasius platythorax TaxID=488582 RepID=A0AAV2N175_9HYME
MDEQRPKRNIIKPQRYQTSSDEADSERKTMELQGSQIEDDVTELRRVLESHSPDINMHANHSLTIAQSIINHDNHTAHASDTTHSLTNAQSLTVSYTTQAFYLNFTSHSLTYAQPLTVTHTTQAPFMHEKSQPSFYARQSFHHTMQTFTHEPHASVATHTQIGSRLNTPHDTQLQVLNI